MNLAEYQRTLLRLSFAQEAQAADFDVLGDRARFQLYRQMIRTRLLGMTKVAFRGACEVVGSAAFEASYARYLEACAPRSPLIRDAVAAFGPFARSDELLLAEAPGFTSDLLRFEETKWRIAYQEVPAAHVAGLREFDFAGAPVLNATLALLPLQHAVHELAQGSCFAGELTLLVYRPPGVDDVRWYVAEPLFADVLRSARAGSAAGLGELVREAAGVRNTALDEALLEQLATSVTLALERGVLLGSRDPA